ncbi:transposase [Microcystis phage Mwe-JY26]
MNLAYTITPQGVSLVLDARMRTVPRSAANFGALINALKSKAPLDTIRRLADIPSFIAKATFGRVQIGGDQVRFDGEQVENVIADRLLDFINQGLDVEPLARFLDRLMDNPIESARKELYLFLESGNNPITEDGCFLAFKKVRDNYRSIHGGKVDNSPGKVVEMDRSAVDPNRHNLCSTGLHFCSWSYLQHFGGVGGTRVVIVKIDPKDVVAIPADYANAKGRTWRYEVVGEVPEDECRHLFDRTPLATNYTSNVVGRDEDGDPMEAELTNADAEDKSAAQGGEGSEEEGDLTFEHAGKSYAWEEVLSLVAEHGQRGMARMTGVPRTTIQGWLKEISDAGLTLEDVPSGQ